MIEKEKREREERERDWFGSQFVFSKSLSQ